MKKFTKDDFNIEEALDELMRGDGVIVFSNVYNLDDIKSAREIVNFISPRQASDAGIGTVYQDLALNALTSVTRNFFLGRELKTLPKTITPDPSINSFKASSMLKLSFVNFFIYKNLNQKKRKENKKITVLIL